MEIILFTLVGIALYILADRMLVWLESIHGEPLPHRQVVYFVLILSLSMGTFALIRSNFQAAQSTQYNNQEQQPADR